MINGGALEIKEHARNARHNEKYRSELINMNDIKLPLDPLVLSIGVEQEPGPVPGDKHTLLEMEFDALSADVIRRMAPDKVICWLFCARYDVHDVADMLQAAGYRGQFLAVAAHLPRKGMITREIRSRFPGLDFRLICPSRLSGRAEAYHGMIAASGVSDGGHAPQRTLLPV